MIDPSVVLWLEGGMAGGLLLGVALARLGRFRIHGWLQGTIVGLNAVVIAIAMGPSLVHHLRSGTRVVLVHAIAGSVAELLGLYIVVSVGLDWLPTRLRIANYKRWMRVTLGAWLVTVALGAWTYGTLNGSGNGGSAPAASHALPSNAGITVKNFGFDPAEITVPVGAEVEWTDQGGRHSVQADDGSFKSETLTAGSTFKRRFDRPGVYRYYCEFHGAAGGHDMAGVVIVK
jgi:plastocyanin